VVIILGRLFDLSPRRQYSCNWLSGILRGFADRPGYVRVFSLRVSDNVYSIGIRSWEQIAGANFIGEANGDGFGNSVSLSNDGKTIAIGADHMMIWVMYRSICRVDDIGTCWQQIGDDINRESAGDYSGASVSPRLRTAIQGGNRLSVQ
jgi:hypothetical protein